MLRIAGARDERAADPFGRKPRRDLLAPPECERGQQRQVREGIDQECGWDTEREHHHAPHGGAEAAREVITDGSQRDGGG